MAACAATLAAAAPSQPNFQGLWYNAPAESESGWGISFAHQEDIIFATWYTYDTGGKGWWLVLQASQVGDKSFAGPIYQVRGPAFSSVPFLPSAVTTTQVGSGSLTFADLSNGTFAYTVNGVSQSKSIMRQAFGPMASCATTTVDDLAATTNYQDLWWADPPGSESGWGVSLSHQGDVIFATWYTYDLDGTPMWLVASRAEKTGPRTYSGDLYRTSGPPFSAVPFKPASVMPSKVGTLSITFDDGNHATYAYTVNGVSQSKRITRQLFRAPTACRYGEGVWRGSTSAGEAVTAVVLEGGSSYVVVNRPNTTTVSTVIQGDAVMDSGALGSSNAKNYAVAGLAETGEQAYAVAMSGTYVAAQSLALTIAGQAPRSITATVDPAAYRSPPLASIAGSYTGISGHVGGRRPANVTIDEQGNLTGSNDVCGLRGTLTPHPGLGVYDVSLRAAGPCIFSTADGIAIYDEASRQVSLLGLYPDRSDMYYIIGKRN